MAIHYKDWLDTEVATMKKKTMKYLGQQYFHRVESRSSYLDSRLMFSPADGVILGAFENIGATESLIQVKGVEFSLRDLMQDPYLKGNFLVVSIFMTFYSQHQNFIPFSGTRVFNEIAPLSTFNKPMLKVENDILNKMINPEFQEDYLRKNGREISTIFSPKLGQEYSLIRVADYDVDSFVNWMQPDGTESMAYNQNDRFGMITYGSQCVLVIEQHKWKDACKFKLRPEAKFENYVKCKEDALVEIIYPGQ